MKIYTYCRQTSLLLSHSTFQTKYFIIAKNISEWVPSSPWLAVYLPSVFYGSCCRTNQADTPQGDHSLLPPAIYIPTHSAPGLGRGRKWSHTACAYVTQCGVLEINQVFCWGLKLPGASDQLWPKPHWFFMFSCMFSMGEGSRWQGHLNTKLDWSKWTWEKLFKIQKR